MIHDAVTQRGKLLIGGIIAPLAGVVFIPTDFRAGRRLRLMRHTVMIQRVDRLCFGMTAVILTDIGHHTIFGAGGFFGYSPYINMVFRISPSIGLTTYRTNCSYTSGRTAAALLRLVMPGIP